MLATCHIITIIIYLIKCAQWKVKKMSMICTVFFNIVNCLLLSYSKFYADSRLLTVMFENDLS